MSLRDDVRWAVGQVVNDGAFMESEVALAEGALEIIAEWCEKQGACRSDDIERTVFQAVADECRGFFFCGGPPLDECQGI